MVQSDCFCPLYFILSYKRHCLPWPDEYLICICCFICMLYNLGLYNHNSSREAAVPAIFSCRTSCSPRGEPGKACQGFHPLSPILPILLPHQCTNLCGSECFHRPEFKGILNCAELFLNKHQRSPAVPLSRLFTASRLDNSQGLIPGRFFALSFCSCRLI